MSELQGGEMSIYNLEKYGLNSFKVLTNAVDEINDGLIFYINKDWSKITDDGYMFNELKLMSNKLSVNKCIELCKSFSHFYFCDFDEETEEIYKKLSPELNLDDVVMEMIQTCTAISTIINYERIGKSND
ncbi:DUF1828 domain-containing protein [Companilactobacillus paralimentarius]|uniref:DUF1828 domain-containing protein n=1 Tax=Companilactobacillus paralimentarius TaxID=83526 RepID=UPI002853171F|nr:DUF1828 domain-containing protein [Companilactobacillus paralimentarius]MDR4934441.1 DUF1828 domain-containing protein [Companilactobacillus paralimentarius]